MVAPAHLLPAATLADGYTAGPFQRVFYVPKIENSLACVGRDVDGDDPSVVSLADVPPRFFFRPIFRHVDEYLFGNA
jgi:hypothetical protein